VNAIFGAVLLAQLGRRQVKGTAVDANLRKTLRFTVPTLGNHTINSEQQDDLTLIGVEAQGRRDGSVPKTKRPGTR
jgi:hypothetical protein